MSQFIPGLKDYVNVPPRPAIHDPAVLQAAAEKLLDGAVRGNILEESQRADSLPQLIDVLASPFRDAYEMARQLDDHHGWDCDTEIVHWLENASHQVWSAHRAAIKQWVRQYEIAPPLEVGKAVTFMDRSVQKFGIVEQFILDTAEYLVRCKEHNDGEGYVVAYEKAWSILATLGESIGEPS